MAAFPLLNHLEIARLAELLNAECAGAHLDRLIVPERADFPEGYLKSDWVFRLEQRRRELALFLSLRPRACSVSLLEGRGPRHSQQATRSPFDQALSKHLKGLRLQKVRSVERERMLVLEFTGYWLIVVLIPALPEALLVDSKTQLIVARSRTIRGASREGGAAEVWAWPEPREVPAQLSVREGFLTDAFCYHREVETALKTEAFRLRRDRVRRAVAEQTKALAKTVRQAEEALVAAQAEPDWSLYGETLKAWLYALPEPEPELGTGVGAGSVWVLGEVRVPTSVGRGASRTSGNPAALIEKFFHLARRRRRRIEEACSRRDSARERLEGLQALSRDGGAAAYEIADGDWRSLVAFERTVGLATAAGEGTASGGEAAAGRALKAAVPARWQGRVFVSKDGFPILVGKSRDENLELTFRIAKGNDLWMHLRGRPGAHVVIPVPPGKSIPLETLLDAAALCIVFSGGRDWGKTEVDYTFKKYVRRIKDSTEASYTHNKTLIASPDPERLERLK